VRVGNVAYGVDLNRRACECRRWQLRGFPCLHGIAAISNLNQNAEAFVAHCYTKQSFLSTYTFNVHPLNGSAMWPISISHKPLPPKKRRLPGRPTVNRKKERRCWFKEAESVKGRRGTKV